MSDTLKSRYGPWALVTGASSGIGEEFARRLAREGFDLMLVARRGDRMAKLGAELADRHGTRVEIVVADLAESDAVDRVLAATAGRDVGLLVSNAGFGLKGGVANHDRAAMEAMLDVNARAPLLLVHGLLPHLVGRATAGVILTGSMEGEAPFPWSAPYAATKAFLHSLGQGLHGELRGSGVDVLVLAPGMTDTEALTHQGFDSARLPGVMSAANVAAQGLARLGRTPVHIPGAVNRMYVHLLHVLPRRWRIALAGKAMAAALKAGDHPVR